jgi:hypothetical protein
LQEFCTQKAFGFFKGNGIDFQYTYCTFNQIFNISNSPKEIIMRSCFKPFLTKFCDLFSISQERYLNIFVLSGSSGMGKSVFGMIFLLFIVNAITVSSLNKPGMATKYSEFFPDFPLPREKKGYVVLYHCKKPSDNYFVLQFDFFDMSWKCVYEGT